MRVRISTVFWHQVRSAIRVSILSLVTGVPLTVGDAETDALGDVDVLADAVGVGLVVGDGLSVLDPLIFRNTITPMTITIPTIIMILFIPAS